MKEDLGYPGRPARSITGGNPVGLPNFRPFNKLSRDEQRAMFAPARPSRPELYQVWVETRKGGFIPVTPKRPLEGAEAFAAAVRSQIALGTEKEWSAPVVLACSGVLGHA